METVLLGLAVLLYVTSFACSIWLAVVAARVSWVWCLLVLFGCGIGTLVFVVKYWDKAKKPFLIGLLTGFLGVGSAIGAAALSASKGGGGLEVATNADGEEVLPAFGDELNRPRARGTGPGDAAGAGAPDGLPFEPTEQPRPIRYKDATQTDTASAAPSTAQPAPAEAGQAAVAPPPPPPPPKPRIGVVSANLVRDEGSGTIEIEVSNESSLAVIELKLTVNYLDARGVQVGTWTTTRQEKPHIAAANGKGKITELAFRMPTAARKVEVRVVSAKLGDGTTVEY